MKPEIAKQRRLAPVSAIKRFFRRRFGKSPHIRWAEKEIDLAVKREMEADKKEATEQGKKYNPKGFSYGGEIYKSALRSYKPMMKSLSKDGHSGMSFSFTKEAIIRLLNELPLTPLKGTDDEWVECGIRNKDGQRDFQNCRCSHVFKHLMPNGMIRYTDIDRAVCVDEESRIPHHLGISSQEVDSVFPITFPYMPPSKPYKVFDRTFDHENAEPGCFDTIAVLRIELPDGKTVPVSKFYKEEGNDFVAIGEEEYKERLDAYEKAKERSSNEESKQ